MFRILKTLFIVLILTTLIACSNNQDNIYIPKTVIENAAATEEIHKIAIEVGQAQSTFILAERSWDSWLTKEDLTKFRENNGDNEYVKEHARKRQQWQEDNINSGAAGYFDTVYEFGLANLGNTAGFEALIFALAISENADRTSHRIDYHKTRDIHERLYKYYLNQSAYIVALKGIRFSQYVGYPKTKWDREAWAASKPSRYKHNLKMLKRAVKNTTNPVVKNHAMLYEAQLYLDNLPAMKDLSEASFGAIVKQNERAEKLLTAVATDKKMPMQATETPALSIYYEHSQKAIRAMMAEELASREQVGTDGVGKSQEQPKPVVLTVYSFAEKDLFDLSKFSIGKQLPTATVPDLEGKPQNLAQYRGRVLLVDFWATWCGPCIAKFPHLRKLKKQYAGRPFEIVGISSDKTLEEVTEFMQDTEMPWDQLYTGAEDGLIQEWRIPSIPRVYLLDHTGLIIIDNPTEEQLDTLLEPLVLQAEQPKTNL